MIQEDLITQYKTLFNEGEVDFKRVLELLWAMSSESRKVIENWHIQKIQEIILDMVNGPGN